MSRFPVARALAGCAAALVALASCSLPRSTSPGSGPTAYATTVAHAAKNAPNIVFVLTDDLSDNLVAQMPQVLSMQRHGTSFSHYYVVDSLCCPSRAAIFTGEFPHDDGVYTNYGDYGGYNAFQLHHDEHHSFVMDLKRAGYTTAFMGKYLNGYGVVDGVPPGWDVWDGVNRKGYSEFNYRLNHNGVPERYGDSPDDYLTNVLSQSAGDFITSAAQRANPFFLEVATFAPHEPYVPSPRYSHAADGALYPATPAYDAQVKNPPPWLHHRRPLTKAREQRMLEQYRLRVEDDYSVDDLIANIRASLRAAGVAGKTYVIFSSDNGYHMGEYRLLSGKQTAFDTDINVPLVVTGPHVPQGATISAMASSVDLAPTFDKLAHAHIDPKTDGVSLLPILSGGKPPDWQHAVLIEHHGHDDEPGDPDAQTKVEGDPPSYEAVRTERGLYVKYVTGAKEYYDTKTDPYELDNLGGKHAPKAMKKALKLLEHCHRAKSCQRAATVPFKKHHHKHH